MDGGDEDTNLGRHRGHFPTDMFDTMCVAGRMVRNTLTGRYRPRHLACVVGMTAAFTYLASPIDAVPDAIPVVGLSDDTAVVSAAVMTTIATGELARYMLWEEQNANTRNRAN